MNWNKHNGRQAASLNMGCHCTPGIRIILKSGVDLPADFATRIKAQIVALVERELETIAEEYEWSLNEEIDVTAEQYVIKSWDDLDKELEPVREGWRKAAEARDAAMKSDPNNGTYGMWSVDGIRHNTVTDATTAPEALAKAIADGEVGDWECATVTFLRPLNAPSPAVPAPEQAKGNK